MLLETVPRRSVTLARFVLDGIVLPLVTETLPLAERVRSKLLGICKGIECRRHPELSDAEIWAQCPAFSGKDRGGQPLMGHSHAFFLPADEDGDGRLDHLTVIADQGFSPIESQALDRLRNLRFGPGDPLSLLLLGLGRTDQFRAPPLAESRVWTSATPFVVTRYPKRRGRKRDQPADIATPQIFARHVLLQELDRLRERRPDLPAVAGVEILERLGPQSRYRSIQFRRFGINQAMTAGDAPRAASALPSPRPSVARCAWATRAISASVCFCRTSKRTAPPPRSIAHFDCERRGGDNAATLFRAQSSLTTRSYCFLTDIKALAFLKSICFKE